MKHVDPPRHPTTLAEARKPTLPHEQDESSGSQAGGTPQQKDQGRQALRNATDGTADTDLGPLMDKIYNEKVAPARGPKDPRQ